VTKIKKLKKNLKLKENIFFKKKILPFFITSILLAVILFFLFSTCFFATCPVWNTYIKSVQISDEEVLYRMNITANTTETKAKEVMNFVYKTIEIKTFDVDSPNGIFNRYIKKYPCLRINSKDHAKYLLNSKCGACGEHAILFSYLMNLLNESAPVLSIQKIGGNHAENEIIVENRRIVIDPSDNIYNESRNIEMFPHKKPTYVNLKYINGTEKELTKEYAGISAGYVNLTFYFLNKPLKNTEMMFTAINGTSFTKYTDDSGKIEFWLGGNVTYKINLIDLKKLITKEESFELKSEEKIKKKINIKIDIILISKYLFVLILWFIYIYLKKRNIKIY